MNIKIKKVKLIGFFTAVRVVDEDNENINEKEEMLKIIKEDID